MLMKTTNYLKDKDFLKKLDLEKNRKSFAKITILDIDERPLRTIEGSITSGSLNIDGNSSMRRTCNLTFLVTEEDNNLTNIDNLLSINKKIKVEIGLENKINSRYPNIIWFKQGIFVITQPSISHNNQGVVITLSCKDKMCLLNGECGGSMPASVILNEYNQINADGSITEVSTKIYDIIQTLVVNYGHEDLNRIFINDVPLEIKQIVRWTGQSNLYYNESTDVYTINSNVAAQVENSQDTTQEEDSQDGTEDVNSKWKIFKYNDDIGYSYVDFTYPGELISGIGDNVCSILDKIKNTLGNFEYFYDIDGNFVFQEIKNYLNKSYDMVSAYSKTTGQKQDENNLAILNNENYYIDLDLTGKVIYDFTNGQNLITSYNNSINYLNLKNDFHIWGKGNQNIAMHYHLAIKRKPSINQAPRQVVFLKGEDDKLTGRIRLYNQSTDGNLKEGENTLIATGERVVDYIPSDWRAELYLQGLEIAAGQNGKRPDIYQQELLDLFDAIYDFSAEWKDENNEVHYGKFKTDMINSPNNLTYFIDYLEPADRLNSCSVDVLGSKVYTYQQDTINKLFEKDVPNIIILNIDSDDDEREKIIDRCEKEGQSFTNVDNNVYSNIAFNTSGYSAVNAARELLYQYTDYPSSISIQSVPIYYLEPNRRITVYDKDSNIYGDYVIKSISLPLDGKTTMSISATKALERI